MNLINKPEVLAPAGDIDCLRAAVNFGADAVYLGGTNFGMRASPSNFTPEQLRQGTAYAHRNGVRVYLTLNTLPRNNEITAMKTYLPSLADSGIDAVIVTDIGVLSLVKKYLPKIEVHISTQAGIVNYSSANAFYELGAKRVILARELTFDEIREIRNNTPPELELEAFVHGAMCMSFSGRCLLSNYMTGRDANRGECAQPCRWNYALVEAQRPGEYYPIAEDEKGSYILNAKDLSMIEYIPQLVDSGLSSLKIEGRAKSEYYVSVITNAYRMAVDSYMKAPQDYQTEDWLVHEVAKVSHRQYSTGFFFGVPEQGQYYENSGYVRKYDVVAIVEKTENGRVYCTQRNKFYPGDEVEILCPRSKPFRYKIGALYNMEENVLDSTAHAKMPFYFEYDGLLPPTTILRKIRTED